MLAYVSEANKRAFVSVQVFKGGLGGAPMTSWSLRIPLVRATAARRPTIASCDKHRHARLGHLTVEPLKTCKAKWAENRDKARFYYDLIPDQDEVLDKAMTLYEAAEHESAPQDWLQLALDLMLASTPNAKGVTEHYAAALVDSMMDDPEIWQGHKPGFSAPVIVRTLREVRRASAFVPAHAEFISLCQKHRQQFNRWQLDLTTLHNIRDAAENILINLGEVAEPDGEYPF
ncbi:hypothetical protein AC629_38695 [Bradyrhizobium sp. NAS80.1]|uniref:hypothetical protein n=1 Tax=Bradyrhizobium sp. NAS80.1 TaxID=1680159 RepID=UPI00095C5BFB|nr:hypothetical protein [Bradyrhizobium sp. NAS80.1]OKO72011.1 hypothetical protein AC629_38695 [Bradyrhizobium sp. NAS80.1]